MTLTSWPFDGQTTTELQFSRMFRELKGNCVLAGHGATALRVTANGSNLTLSIAVGAAMVRGHYMDNDSAATLTLAGGSAAARTDIIVLRLNPSANSIVPAIVQGTSGGGVPALTQTTDGIWEFPLARIAVAAGASAVSNSNVTDLRVFAGGEVGVWTTATRPAAPSRIPSLGLNVQTNVMEYYDGTNWQPVVPQSLFTNLQAAQAQASSLATQVQTLSNNMTTLQNLGTQLGLQEATAALSQGPSPGFSITSSEVRRHFGRMCVLRARVMKMTGSNLAADSDRIFRNAVNSRRIGLLPQGFRPITPAAFTWLHISGTNRTGGGGVVFPDAADGLLLQWIGGAGTPTIVAGDELLISATYTAQTT